MPCLSLVAPPLGPKEAQVVEVSTYLSCRQLSLRLCSSSSLAKTSLRIGVGIIGDGKAVNKSAASAASLDYVKFQAVIKSAARAASRKTKSQGPRSRGAPEPRRPHAEPSSVGSPGSWSLIFGLPGGCASSQLDHGLKV